MLDGKGARATAAGRTGIGHAGLAGLPGELASAGGVPAHEMNRMAAALRRPDFRVRSSLLDGLAGGIRRE